MVELVMDKPHIYIAWVQDGDDSGLDLSTASLDVETVRTKVAEKYHQHKYVIYRVHRFAWGGIEPSEQALPGLLP